MFGKILYLSDTKIIIENKANDHINNDLINIHLIFEKNEHKILGEITEVRKDEIEVKFLGEFINGKYYGGVIRKPSLDSNIRVINQNELFELIGVESKNNFLLGMSATYNGFRVYPNINEVFSNHMCIFGNSGSGKSCGVARIIQNILENKNSLAYNANIILFDSFGEYKNAFKSINNINQYYNYKFITSKKTEASDKEINIPLNLMKVDDYAVLLQIDKHTQLTIIERAINYAKIFSMNTQEAIIVKNHIIANALLTVLFSQETTQAKKDKIFSIIDTCHTNEFNFNAQIPGIGYTRNFSECFLIDSKGRFGEEVLITEYILKYVKEESDDISFSNNSIYTLEELSKALEFTLISEGFNQNKNMHDDAQLIRVRLNSLIQSNIGSFFNGKEYVSPSEFITRLVSDNGKKSQIININLESIDDVYAKALVKIYSRIIFDFAKENANRATVPFHLFLEEAHRYIQHDTDVFLLGYNIFDRIAKEGRKYGVILDIISQRPVEISDTVISQCSNFFIFKMTHPKDIKYIEEMLPNISSDVIDKMKVLVSGTCVAFGSAFKIPMIVRLDMPSPRPYSSSCNVSSYWDSMDNINKNFEQKEITQNVGENTNNGSMTKIELDVIS